MVVVNPALPALTGELALFHTTDPLLSNSPVLVYYGPAASISSTTSRIQVHVFTPAGLESYTRLAISPNSPYYGAVSALPREEQGDEVCRGLAFGLAKYFAEIPQAAKNSWIAQASGTKKPASAFLFTHDHVAILAARMNRVENADEIIDDIQRALGEQHLSWLDLDVVLPPGSITPAKPEDGSSDPDALDEDELCARRYGPYASFVKMLGEPSFLPTSKLKRAPSKPTAIGRSQAFLRDQRESARKEMCELVETEANYVDKLTSLVNEVAKDLRNAAAADKTIPLTTPAERILMEIFPPALSKILLLNSEFLGSIRHVLGATQQAATADIESSVEETSGNSITDEIGLSEFAKCLVEWFPRFSDAYPAYVRAHSRFPKLLRRLSSQADKDLLTKLQDIGEQRLTSALIEPVQRLPRYTLYIDSIAKQLPVGHSALKPLLRARDIITDICSQDAGSMQESSILERLRRLVQEWPAELDSVGRFITAADVAELIPPYEPTDCRASTGILLLFTDCAIYLEKRGANAMSARALLGELSKPLIDDRRDSSLANALPSLQFLESFSLHDSSLTEYMNHRAIDILPLHGPMTEAGMVPEHRVYLLEGTYAGKASKFQEEWTKARVEGRFSEEERESGKWEVRTAQSGAGEINLFNAIFEEGKVQHYRRVGAPARVRVVIDPGKHEHQAELGNGGIEAVVSLTTVGTGQWQIVTESAFGAPTSTKDKVTEEDFLPVLVRRLTGIQQARYSTRNKSMVSSFVLRNQLIIDELHLQFLVPDALEAQPNGSKSHDHRPKSPSKLLSGLLSPTQPRSPKKLQLQRPLMPHTLTDPPMMLEPPALCRPEDIRPHSHDGVPEKRPGTAPSLGKPAFGDSLKRLEDTLGAYSLALQARKGNIVGKIVQARSRANELAVNELYNALLEDPNLMVVAAQASIDVLFAAFEKFLNVAWTEQIGPVLSVSQLQTIQKKAESLFPVDFEKYFKGMYCNMLQPNQRALRCIIKLLAELLDGTGNDGDRGILTAAFAEIVVPGADPYHYVSLFDRFVDDIEPLFGEVVMVSEVRPLHSGDPTGSAGSRHKRSRSVNTGSLTSNTSSLRKKFGFGLSRENSKSEQDSKVGSVWRTLSKSTRAPDQPINSPRGKLQRSNTTDHPPMVRASSEDRLTTPTGPRPSTQDSSSSSLHQPSSPLSAIKEIASPQSTGLSRKKRRSSLSDLKTLDLAIGDSPFMSPSAMLRFDSMQDDASKTSLPATPSISKNKPTALRTPLRTPTGASFGSPLQTRTAGTNRKENSPGPERAYNTDSIGRARGTSVARPMFAHNKLHEAVTITSYGSLRKPTASSNIPTLSPSMLAEGQGRRPSVTPSPLRPAGLSERPTSGNAMKIRAASPSAEKTLKLGGATTPKDATPWSSPTKRLKMQSPQKLRERLQEEQRNISAAQNSLQDELSKIGDEISGMYVGGSLRGNNRHGSLKGGSAADFAARLAGIQADANDSLTGLQDRVGELSATVSTSLSVSETKARRLDELYREANAENEALYSRFNDELSRVLKAVKGGEGANELKRKVKEEHEEAARLRRENARLKREVLGLRSQLKE